MAETVGQHSVAAFTSPVNGTTPIDANTVRGNDNTVRSAYVDHDADPGIHVQSSTLASRPVAGTAGRKWITVSSGRYQLWYDDGSRWHEVASDAVNVDCLADEALTKGDVIKITGFNNGQNLPTVAKTTSATDTAFGIVENTVASGAIVQIVNTGIIEDVNTNGYAIGTILYPNASGGFTTTKPTSGNYQPAAYVLRGNTNTGVLYAEFSAPRIVERSDNTASTIVLRDASGNFAAGTITAGALTSTGLVTFASLKGTGATTVTNILDEDNMASDSATALATQQSIKAYVDAKVATVDTLAEVLANGNTTGANNIIVSTGQKIQTPTIAAFDNTTAISIANTTGALTLATALADSNLATISTAGKVANSATTATALNTSSAIVARDSSGNFAAGTITANLTGNISGTAPAGTLTGTTLASNVVSSSLTSVGTLSSLTVSGDITASAGSSTDPSITFSGYTNWGLGIDGTGLRVVAGGAGTTTTFTTSGLTTSNAVVTGDLTVDTSTLKVDSTNNRVGIGTASPSYRTDISNGGGSAAALRVLGNDQSNVRLRIENSGSGGRAFELTGGLTGANNSDFTLYDATAAATRLSVDASGNLAVDTNTLYVDAANNRVGIGTSSPAVRLDIQGLGTASGYTSAGNAGIKVDFDTANNGVINMVGGGDLGVFRSNSSNAYDVGISFGDNSNRHLTFTTANAERMRLDASGRLGIGTSSPGYPLDVAGEIRSPVWLGRSNTSVPTADCAMYRPADNSLAFSTANTERMRLDASGNLGVGTTSPIAKLDVRDGYIVSGDTASTNGSKILGGYYSSGNIATFGGERSNGGPVLGYGVWPSPSAAASFVSSTAIAVGRGAYTILGPEHIWYGGATQTVAIDSAVTTTERMRLDASGNLGIATSAPTAPLSVVNSAATPQTKIDTYETAQFRGGSIAYIRTSGGSVDALFGAEAGGSTVFAGSYTNHPFILRTNNTERARITSGGDVLIGGTTSTDTPSTGFTLLATSGSLIGIGHANGTANATSYATFAYNGTRIGWIEQDTTSSVKYNTSSDRRLKDNIVPAQSAGDIIDGIEIVSHDWKDGGHVRYGVIAQDLHSIVPEAVSVGDGDDVEEVLHPWGVDYSKLVPMLVKAIQELNAKNASLEARLAALEN